VKTEHLYQPFYCEENVWHLCQRPELTGRASALFISNANRTCALWNQRAANPGDPVVWDYHVVAVSLAEGLIWDLDTRLPLPVPLRAYLDGTFTKDPRLPDALAPLFRLIDGSEYVASLVSDRSHMLNDEGEYREPPPAWDPIGAERADTLQRFIDMEAETIGEVLTLSELELRAERLKC
jgi:hypothetical protein